MPLIHSPSFLATELGAAIRSAHPLTSIACPSEAASHCIASLLFAAALACSDSYEAADAVSRVIRLDLLLLVTAAAAFCMRSLPPNTPGVQEERASVFAYPIALVLV